MAKLVANYVFQQVPTTYQQKERFFLHLKRAWVQIQEWEASPRLSRAPPTSRALLPLPGTDYGFCPPACDTTATNPCTAHTSFTTLSIPSSRSRRRAERGLLAASSVLVVVIIFPLITFLYLDLISLTNLSWALCRFRFSCFLKSPEFCSVVASVVFGELCCLVYYTRFCALVFRIVNTTRLGSGIFFPLFVADQSSSCRRSWISRRKIS